LPGVGEGGVRVEALGREGGCRGGRGRWWRGESGGGAVGGSGIGLVVAIAGLGWVGWSASVLCSLCGIRGRWERETFPGVEGSA
jgi:hypothetical protein